MKSLPEAAEKKTTTSQNVVTKRQSESWSVFVANKRMIFVSTVGVEDIVSWIKDVVSFVYPACRSIFSTVIFGKKIEIIQLRRNIQCLSQYKS